MQATVEGLGGKIAARRRPRRVEDAFPLILDMDASEMCLATE